MNFQFTSQSLEQTAVDVVFVTCFEKKGLRQSDEGTLLDRALGGELSRTLRERGFEGKEGETLLVPTFGKIKPKYVLIVGLGSPKDFVAESIGKLGGKAVTETNRLRQKSLGGFLEAGRIGNANAAERVRAFAEGAGLASYQFLRFKTGENSKKKNTCESVVISCRGQTAPFQKIAHQAQAVVEGVCLARDLTNLPPNVLTPRRLGEEAIALTKKHKNISVKVFGPEQIRAQKMGALLAVAQGSEEPPAFIHLKYTPPKKSKTKVALVGKGITFDSGGLNIKTREMEEMKMDMAGAAAVLGAFHALAQIKPNVAVEGFIPAAENMPAGSAYRPSDILTTRSGKTVEILNTDAEGRLALADALDYARETKPTYMIDMATLTGGAAYALGELYTSVLGNDKRLVEKILSAGRRSGELAWELPIVKAYKKGYLKGPADLKNSGSGTKASTIAGALFLEEFVGDNKWVHMDIASTAWVTEPTEIHPVVGATGVPVRTLVYFLMDL